MYSLNAPVPGRVRRIASELYPDLAAFERVREDHSLLVKRLGDDVPSDRVASLAREALAGAPAFEVATTGLDYFEAPPTGTAPVVYVDVESPGLERVHEQLVEELGAVEHLEGEDFVPHVTLARQGDLADAERVVQRDVEEVVWTVSELEVTDAERDRTVATVSLPA